MHQMIGFYKKVCFRWSQTREISYKTGPFLY